MNKIAPKTILLFAIPLFMIGITIIIILYKGHINFEDVNFDKLGGFGGFIGGLIGSYLTLIATYYVYKTYKSQKKELKKQRELINQQQFESTFFNMLNVHRELKNNLFSSDRIFWFTDNQIDEFRKFEFKDTEDLFNQIINERERKGINVFRNIRLDLINLFNNEKITKQINFYNEYKLLKDNQFILNLKKKLETLRDEFLFSSHSDEKLVNITFKLIFEIYEDVISHYCRNVYHILKYIRQNEINETLGKDSKKYKNYADIFQSQMNVDEQFLLFYNFIYFNGESENINFETINLVNDYSFLENIGLDNLINKEHENFYNFKIKGSGI